MFVLCRWLIRDKTHLVLSKGVSEVLFKTSDDRISVNSIWSRRGNLASAPQVLTSKTVEKKLKKDHENVKYEPISRVLFNATTDQEEEQEEEIFTPDKEILAPSTHESMGQFAMLKEMEKSSSAKSPLVKMLIALTSTMIISCLPCQIKKLFSRTQQKQRTARRASANQVKSIWLKDRKVGRTSFQSLLASLPQKNTSECSIPDADAKSEIYVDSALNACKGIICETPEEFRESLVNPFSERFRWADSSPRGQTWSCADDFVLKERFYPSSLKMTLKAMENVKGLKLILLHNSRYYERMTAVH